MSSQIAFLVVILLILVGEWVSKLTHAYIPSIFITAFLFLIGFWTFMPKDVVARASFGTEFVTICVPLLLVHLGTLMNFRTLLRQWKAVCIALLGVCGTLLATLTVGTAIFGFTSVVAAVPPLTGGLVAALLMTDGLKAAGVTALVALPTAMFVMHSLIGYPITGYMLKREARRLTGRLRRGEVTPTERQLSNAAAMSGEGGGRRVLGIAPDSGYLTAAFTLARVGAVALVAALAAQLLNGVVNANILCLVLGVIAHELGFLEDNALNKACVFNWLMYGLLAYIFAQLSVTTPQAIGGIIVQIVVLILLGLAGMLVASLVLARPFGMSFPMAFACSLTALFGFPADYILTTEICRSESQNERERGYLLEEMLPKMLVGGFATVSIASVVIASVFLKLV